MQREHLTEAVQAALSHLEDVGPSGLSEDEKSTLQQALRDGALLPRELCGAVNESLREAKAQIWDVLNTLLKVYELAVVTVSWYSFLLTETREAGGASPRRIALESEIRARQGEDLAHFQVSRHYEYIANDLAERVKQIATDAAPWAECLQAILDEWIHRVTIKWDLHRSNEREYAPVEDPPPWHLVLQYKEIRRLEKDVVMLNIAFESARDEHLAARAAIRRGGVARSVMRTLEEQRDDAHRRREQFRARRASASRALTRAREELGEDRARVEEYLTLVARGEYEGTITREQRRRWAHVERYLQDNVEGPTRVSEPPATRGTAMCLHERRHLLGQPLSISVVGPHTPPRSAWEVPWTRTRLWRLYVHIQKTLADGSTPFTLVRVISALLKGYKQAWPNLDVGLDEFHQISTYGDHAQFAIDIGADPNTETYATVRDNLELPRRFGSGWRYKWRSSRIGAASDPLTGTEDVFSKLAYGMGLRDTDDIRPTFADVELAAAAAAAGRMGEGSLARPEGVPTRYLSTDRILAGLGTHYTVKGSEAVPPVNAARSALLLDLGEHLRHGTEGLTRMPFNRAAIDGVTGERGRESGVQTLGAMWSAGELPRTAIHRNVSRWLRENASFPSSDPNPDAPQGFADRVWWIMVLCFLAGADARRHALNLKILHRYERTGGNGPEQITVVYFLTHLRARSIGVGNPVVQGTPLGVAGATDNATSIHNHIQLHVFEGHHEVAPREAGRMGGLWPHEFFPTRPPRPRTRRARRADAGSPDGGS